MGVAVGLLDFLEEVRVGVIDGAVAGTDHQDRIFADVIGDGLVHHLDQLKVFHPALLKT